ncbi:RidA family protein [Isoptericola haloaureus]|uniref:RidA family protein n=1 Tax=Isoptericola haloaureus TaxID=1542902 RepID=A0ABU7Z740_9MICO
MTDTPDARPRRTSIELDAFGHENPVPVGSRIGPFLASGVLTGRDPRTREMPADLSTQCANMFGHVRALLAAAGGSTDDVLTLTVRLADFRDREALNREWLAMFPDPTSRPARRVVAADLDRGALVQCDLWAVLDGTAP